MRVPQHGAAAFVIFAQCLQALADETRVLEEVIVVAQKRPQNLQDIPVAVSAFSGADLELSGVKDAFDLAGITPGLEVRQGGSANDTRFRIRSIGTQSSNFGLESAVGLYVDGVYRARQGSMVNNMVDMESVEVLRGPQGTLFGRNTLVGAVLFNTVPPDHDLDNDFVEVTAGNYDLLNLSGAVSISAVEDILAFRIAGFSSQREGYVDDIKLGDNRNYDRDRWGARLQALYTPSDSLSVRVIADYSSIDEICCAALVVQDNLRPAALPPGAVSYAGTDEVVRALGGTVFGADQFYDHITAQSLLPASKNDDSGLGVTVGWDLGPISLVSITGYRSYETHTRRDVDSSDLDSLNTQTIAEQSAWSQELRISQQGKNFSYVAGLYYFQQDLDNVSTLEVGEDINGVASHTFVYFPGSDGQFPLDAIPSFPLPQWPLFPPDSGARNYMQQEHEAHAIFAQVDYDLSGTLTLTAGARYTREHKDLSGYFTEGSAPDFNDGVTAPPFVLERFPLLAPREPVAESLRDERVTGTLKLTWFIDVNKLLYASYGTGYKAGGTNTDRLSPDLEYIFYPETSEAFEIGFKGEFPEQALRLNLALHRTDIEDLQINSLGPNGFVLQNAGKVDTWGGEIEVTWMPTDSLTVTAAYANTVGEVVEWEGDLCWVAAGFHTGRPDPGDASLGENTTTCDRSGIDLPFNPDQLVLTAHQVFNLYGQVDGFWLLEYSHYGESEVESHDPYLGIPSYELVNARLGLHFDEYAMDIILWGRNLLDEEYRMAGVDAIGEPGRVIATPLEPTTWGITLRKAF